MAEAQGWESFLRALSWVFGWTYFIAWSASFYPQAILNIRRKSTAGLTVDFPLLNVLGFACYTTSTSAFLFNDQIRKQYAIRHPISPRPTVRINDFVFALHALLMCALTYSQLWHRLWGFDEIRGKQASRAVQGVFWGSLAGIGLVGVIVWAQHTDAGEDSVWTGIDVIYAVSYVKLLVTCVKYMPQAWNNYKVKSTKGWAVGQIQLDMIGSVLSISQLIIDSALEADWSGITGNPVKLLLGNVSLFFDLIFITQHYWLYGDVAADAEDMESTGEDERLLPR